jgi:hypothetical protein
VVQVWIREQKVLRYPQAWFVESAHGDGDIPEKKQKGRRNLRRYEQRLERREKTTSYSSGTTRMATAAHRARNRGASFDINGVLRFHTCRRYRNSAAFDWGRNEQSLPELPDDNQCFEVETQTQGCRRRVAWRSHVTNLAIRRTPDSIPFVERAGESLL